MNANEHISANGANGANETGGQLRERLGIQPRTFQKNWLAEFGTSFDSRRTVTLDEARRMESRFAEKGKRSRQPYPKQIQKPEKAKEEPKPKQAAAVHLPTVDGFQLRVFSAWALFLLPTAASFLNTVSVSGAFSQDKTTALLITVTVSAAGIFWILSKPSLSWGDVIGVIAFQGIETFSNFAQTNKSLMGTMSYGISTVTGEPSELLNMVAVVTNSDHRATSVALAGAFSLFLLAAQVKGILLIKEIKGK